MTPAITINDLSLRMLIEMVVDDKPALFKSCATKMVKELDNQIQECSNIKQISKLQHHSSIINQMINEYSLV